MERLNLKSSTSSGAVLAKNLAKSIEIHLKSSWSHGCPLNQWSAVQNRCTLMAARYDSIDEVSNRPVRIIADANRNCVEYDLASKELIATRKECNLGNSIFKFQTSIESAFNSGDFSLILLNKNKTLGSLKTSPLISSTSGSTTGSFHQISLIPRATKLSNSFYLSPDGHLVYIDEHHQRSYAAVAPVSFGNPKGGRIIFSTETPLKSQHECLFYAEPLPQELEATPHTSQEDLKNFLIKYYSDYSAPFFRIGVPFWGEKYVIRTVKKKAPTPPPTPSLPHYPPIETPWWQTYIDAFFDFTEDDVYDYEDAEDAEDVVEEKEVDVIEEDDDDIAQLWRFQRIRFNTGNNGAIIVNITSAKTNESFCLSADNDHQGVGVNNCDNHQGWELQFVNNEYFGGTVKFKIPGADLCLYRLDPPSLSLPPSSSSSSSRMDVDNWNEITSNEQNAQHLHEWVAAVKGASPVRLSLGPGFFVKECKKDDDLEVVMSLFSLKVLLNRTEE